MAAEIVDKLMKSERIGPQLTQRGLPDEDIAKGPF
jgi:hypothetical protein